MIDPFRRASDKDQRDDFFKKINDMCTNLNNMHDNVILLVERNDTQQKDIEKIEKTVYGERGNNGLRGDMIKIKAISAYSVSILGIVSVVFAIVKYME